MMASVGADGPSIPEIQIQRNTLHGQHLNVIVANRRLYSFRRLIHRTHQQMLLESYTARYQLWRIHITVYRSYFTTTGAGNSNGASISL